MVVDSLDSGVEALFGDCGLRSHTTKSTWYANQGQCKFCNTVLRRCQRGRPRSGGEPWQFPIFPLIPSGSDPLYFLFFNRLRCFFCCPRAQRYTAKPPLRPRGPQHVNTGEHSFLPDDRCFATFRFVRLDVQHAYWLHNSQLRTFPRSGTCQRKDLARKFTYCCLIAARTNSIYLVSRSDYRRRDGLVGVVGSLVALRESRLIGGTTWHGPRWGRKAKVNGGPVADPAAGRSGQGIGAPVVCSRIAITGDHSFSSW